MLSKIEDLQIRISKVLFENILPFWFKNSVDARNGGFLGRVTNDAKPVEDAPKALILNTRILWTFSKLFTTYKEPLYLEYADRAFDYLLKYFLDPVFGGMFWLVDATGNVIDDKKKMYGQAFAIYAFTEYFRATKKAVALDRAVELFHLMVQHAYDKKYAGFLETTNRDWSPTEDMRLSEKDLNEAKSMNTHLHIMEAFTNLYQVWPKESMHDHFEQIIRVFLEYIFNPEINHLNSFFKIDWTLETNIRSFGHDIEASWLLTEALSILGNEDLLKQGREISIKLTRATLKEGLGPSYAVYKGTDESGNIIPVMEWWQQAEGCVGALNAYQITKDEFYFDYVLRIWQFIENNFVDWKEGEWFYEVGRNGKPVEGHFKISEWKGPYHNIRACLEVLRRLKDIMKTMELK